MIETVVESIRVSLVTQHRVVILKEVHGERHLPIWIGAYEAEAIAMELQGVSTARPLPYDLMKSMIGDMGGAINRIVVTDLSDDVFYARIVIQQNGRAVEIDSRPSDAIALAIRAKVPIYVEDAVLDQAGMVFESEGEEQEGETQAAPVEVLDETKLSVFKEFIETLDIEDLGKGGGQEKPERT